MGERVINRMVKDYKKSSEQFKTELGFKSCDLNPSEKTQDDIIVPRKMEKLEGDCENFKGNMYNCKTYIDPNTKKISKSDCDQK